MGRIQFSLTSLLMAVLVVGVCLGALRSESEWWSSAMLTLTVGGLMFALAMAIEAPAPKGRFWLGCFLFGGSYLLLSYLVPWGRSYESSLVSPRLLWRLEQWMLPLDSEAPIKIEWHGTWYPGSLLQMREGLYEIHYDGYADNSNEWVPRERIRPHSSNFPLVAKTLVAWIWTVIGGLLANVMSAPRDRWLTRWGWSVVLGILAIDGLATWWANDLWTSAAFSLTLGLHLAAVLGLLYQTGAARAGWRAFAAVGWMYLLLVFAPFFDATIGQQLLTTKIFDFLQPDPSARININNIYQGSFGINQGALALPLWSYRHVSGHSLFALQFALLAGLIASRRATGDHVK